MRAVSAVAPCCVCRTQPKSERPPLAFVPDARPPPSVFSISLAGVKINLPFRAAMRTRLLLIACFVAGLWLTSPHPVPPVPFIIASAVGALLVLIGLAAARTVGRGAPILDGTCPNAVALRRMAISLALGALCGALLLAVLVYGLI